MSANPQLFSAGFMTTPLGATHHSFISTSQVRKTGIDWPDIQMYFLVTSAFSGYADGVSWMFKLDPKHFESFMQPLLGKNTVGMAPVLVRPKSQGEIRLRSKDPFEKPIIDPRYLEHPADVQAFIEGKVLKVRESSLT